MAKKLYWYFPSLIASEILMRLHFGWNENVYYKEIIKVFSVHFDSMHFEKLEFH